jgi:predicted dehydrogenase
MTAIAPEPRPPRLGFLGVGWIGRHRLEAIVHSGVADVVMVADPSPQARADAARTAGAVEEGTSLDDLLRADLDGVVIATPSALHAEQAIAAMNHGRAVFCQKPLARDASEARRVVDAAREADRLLDVDLSYRQLRAMQALRAMVSSDALGHVFAIETTFHNAYGPDKTWSRDRTLAGGGCLIDLGVHLVDAALWLLDFPAVKSASGRLFAGGRPLDRGGEHVEDYATARIDVEGGTTMTLACSWGLAAGRGAVIRVACYGTRGGAAVENIDGSFYDFRALHFKGDTTDVVVDGADPWGGRAIVSWARTLAGSPAFSPEAQQFVRVADVLDRVYAS